MTESIVRILLRPVGHVSKLMATLARWKRNRIAKDLDVGDLSTAMDYLEEYRTTLRNVQRLKPLSSLLEAALVGAAKHPQGLVVMTGEVFQADIAEPIWAAAGWDPAGLHAVHPVAGATGDWS